MCLKEPSVAAHLPGHPVTLQPAPILGQILSRAAETATGPHARLPHTETCPAGKENEVAGVQKVSQRMYKSAKDRSTLETK